MSEEIKGCPCCNGEPQSNFVTGMVSLWRVGCKSCGLNVEYTCKPFDAESRERAKAKAEAAWNTRAHDGDGWRDIESAPKDGTVVVVYRSKIRWPTTLGPVRDFVERCELGWFEDGRWWEAGTAHDMHEPWRIDNGSEPTHWRPLPAPPQSTLEQEKRG